MTSDTHNTTLPVTKFKPIDVRVKCNKQQVSGISPASLIPHHDNQRDLVCPDSTSMSASEEEGKAICILSFDSGGPGTYSQLLILKEYMIRLAKDLDLGEEDVYPADYFDLMGGVGFGGLVSIMLGRLKMSVGEAIDALVKVATTDGFPKDSQDEVDPDANSRDLRDAIEDMLHERGIPVTTKMCEQNSPQTRCKVVIYAATSDNVSHSQAFRTYPIRGSSLNPTIVEAVCGTMAIPSHLLPVKLGLSQRRVVGGTMGANNPTRELLKEAEAIFGRETVVAQVISLGCGVPPSLSSEVMTNETEADQSLKETPVDCQVAKELAVRLYDVDAYLRLSVGNGIGSIDISPWERLEDIEMHTACYVTVKAVANAIRVSLKRLQWMEGTVTLGLLNQASSTKIATKVPPVSPYFVLPKKHWENLVCHLVRSYPLRQTIVLVTGVEGCGKTQLVLYFLQKYPTLFKHIAYVDASSLSCIEMGLKTWARTIGDGHGCDSWEDAVRILASATEDEQLGLILDNADEATLDLAPIIPEVKNLTAIVTSRTLNLGNISTTFHIELGVMEQDEALSLLLHTARCQLPLSIGELKGAHALLDELRCLALAIVQAGTYCHELSYSFKQYLDLFCSHRAELRKTAEVSSLDNHQQAVHSTLEISYKALTRTSQDFLHSLSFFHHTNIPLAALSTAAGKSFQDPFECSPRSDTHACTVDDLKTLLCVDGNWNELQVQEMVRSLRSFSLLSISSFDDHVFLQLHPSIQAWLRNADPSNSQHHQAMSHHVLTACCGADTFLIHRYLVPHILDMVDQWKAQDAHVNDRLAAGKFLNEQGYHQKAAELYETVLDTLKDNNSSSSSNDQNVATISGWLAGVYWAQGQYDKTEKMEMEVLELLKKVLTMEHPDTMEAAANLAATYQARGQWTEAEKLRVELLELQKTILGVEHEDTMGTAANLVVTYHAQGKWSEAEELGVIVLEQRKRVLGMEHPSTIQVMANLATVYNAQGRWSEAESLRVELLELQRRILGMEHENTVGTAANLAVTYNAQGRWSEAEKLEVEVWEWRKRHLGNEHLDTIMAAANLAGTYRAQGLCGEAEKMEVEVLGQRRRILGKEHPDTILAAANLAVTYGKQAQWEECIDLLVPAVQLSLKILGQHHPDTQTRLEDLVFVYEEMGREKEAQETRDLLIS